MPKKWTVTCNVQCSTLLNIKQFISKHVRNVHPSFHTTQSLFLKLNGACLSPGIAGPILIARLGSVHQRFYPRDAMLARVFAIATCPSFCLSVTRRYCA